MYNTVGFSTRSTEFRDIAEDGGESQESSEDMDGADTLLYYYHDVQ